MPSNDEESAADFLPARRTLPALRAAAAGCRGCDLWRVGTRTVFGVGKRTAELLIIGEQPGDQEDREGVPFVGPSGHLLDSAMETAGLDRRTAYVTNAVKHFKWTADARGKRRIHQKPNDGEMRACRPWLMEELRVVKPRVVLALGATAAKSLLGPKVRVTADRGRAMETELAEAAFVTLHPSAILRTPSAGRAEAEQAFIDDLRAVTRYLARG